MAIERRFWLFSGMDYYASGGTEDLKGRYGTEGDARAALEYVPADHREWWEIVDVVDGIVVADGGFRYSRAGKILPDEIPLQQEHRRAP